MINHSAKDLISRSCKQLWYFQQLPPREVKRKKEPSAWQIEGTNFQDMIINTHFPNCCPEMCGMFEYNGNAVFFSNDICYEDKCIEVKWVDEESVVPDWYLQSSLVQCALYSSFIKHGCTLLHTAKFAVSNGRERKVFQINQDASYYLRFGNDTYVIKVLDPKPLINYIKEKLDCISDYYRATYFDQKYKHREFELFKNTFEFRKLSDIEAKLLEEQ